MVADFKTFGRYELISVLGRGGFATVYRARDPHLDRLVALKTLQPHVAEDSEIRQRFLAEARAIARLRHPNIITVHEADEVAGEPYYTMELIEGQTLDQLLSGDWRPSADELYSILAPVASAIDYLHGMHIVHRDIKPANIMVDKDGRVLLMDFGIARLIDDTRLTATGAILGTPAYMAPEQATGAPVGPATDIYALGVLAYHLLAGRPPFSGNTASVLRAQAYDPAPDISTLRPDLDPLVRQEIAAALAKEPDVRPPTATALVAALRPAPAQAAPSSSTALPPTVFIQPPHWTRPPAAAGETAKAGSDAPDITAGRLPDARFAPTMAVPSVPVSARDRDSAPGRRRTGRLLLPAAIALVILLAAGGVMGIVLTRRRSNSNAPANAVSQTTGSQMLPSQGNIHVNPGDTHVTYSTDPPTSGPHFPTVPRRGIYTTPFVTEYLPHFLEHGGVEVQYNKTTPPDVVTKLTDIVNKELGYNIGQVLLAPRPDMPCEIAVTAWQHIETFGASDCQPGSVGHNFDAGVSSDTAAVTSLIEHYMCAYDPENQCGNGVRGAITYPTARSGEPTVTASLGTATSVPSSTR